MKQLILIFALITMFSCEQQPEPMVVIDEHKSLRTRWLAGEMYFTTVYKVQYKDQIRSVERVDLYDHMNWEVGDTVGWNGKYIIPDNDED